MAFKEINIIISTSEIRNRRFFSWLWANLTCKWKTVMEMESFDRLFFPPRFSFLSFFLSLLSSFSSFQKKTSAILKLSCELIPSSWIHELFPCVALSDGICSVVTRKPGNISWSNENQKWPAEVWGHHHDAKAALKNLGFCKTVVPLALHLAVLIHITSYRDSLLHSGLLHFLLLKSTL